MTTREGYLGTGQADVHLAFLCLNHTTCPPLQTGAPGSDAGNASVAVAFNPNCMRIAHGRA